MDGFELKDLKRILLEAAGDDGVPSVDVPFVELGYDSLAMFETVSRISREYDVPLPDDLATGMATPRDLMGLVNSLLPVISI